MFVPSNPLSQLHSNMTLERETIMTNLFKKQQKQSPLAAIALLSVLLGAQIAAFAGVNIGGDGSMPPAFNFGFNSAVTAYSLFPADARTQQMFIVGACQSHYSRYTDYNECIYGAEQA